MDSEIFLIYRINNVMKNFRKTPEGLFICEECNKTYKDKKNGICHHVYKEHDAYEYYNKWIKEENDDRCKICNNKTDFWSLSLGYMDSCCNIKCQKLYRIKKSREKILEKYGVTNVYKLDFVKDKRNKTMKEKYGAEQTSNSEILKERRKQTFIKKYGVTSYVLTKEFNEKRKKSCIKKFGTENNSQNQENFEMGQKTRLTLHQFKNTDIWYQGSYELDFLEKYYEKYTNIQRAPSIKYFFNGKLHYYHPDFYIPSLNLIIEIKSSYLLKRDKEKIEEKEKSTISNGFKYIIIIDKNYKEFNMLSSS
jgi:hypothetical protein